MKKGVVKKWFDEKGYGFIKPEDGSDDVFMHFSQWKGEGKKPTVDDKVTYDIGKNPKNQKPQAENVHPA